MEPVLRKLYNGELDPVEKYRPRIEEHIALRKRNWRHYEAFTKKLEGSCAREFEQIMDEQADVIPFELEETFMDGFRLGGQMMLELLRKEAE